MVTKTRPEINTLAEAKTSLRAAEAALEISIERERHLKEAMEKRIAEFSHDVKNPLGAMIACSELIKDEIMGPFESKVYKEYICCQSGPPHDKLVSRNPGAVKDHGPLHFPFAASIQPTFSR